ncbi:MAG: nickel pincer cofactor biosynthesis protein LarC [Methanoregulaceae archaeon]|nr:nickel pincer cofactor biosynthesis protein LarC [Methanoregulaceae archaeon]
MVRFLVFDPFHGSAGDMITGALLDLGADRQRVMQAMRSVVDEPHVSSVSRAGVRAMRVETNATSATRSFDEVLACLKTADASEEAIVIAERVFRRIDEAEKSVHGESTHFHEVGADDAIADVIGACTALVSLKPDIVVVLPIHLGSGISSGSHGIFPIPAPATAAILARSDLRVIMGREEEGELCTPTGAALLAEFSSPGARVLPDAVVIAVGYGAGSRDYPGTPNVLRAFLADSDLQGGCHAPLSCDCVDVLETNVDDVNGEVLASALSSFMEAGARDASAIPCLMKKGRAGQLVRVICETEKSQELATLMARELGTLGIRCQPMVHRFIAERKTMKVSARIAGQEREVTVKCGLMNGECYTLKAEYEEAFAWARDLGIPVREVARIVEDTARDCYVNPYKRS